MTWHATGCNESIAVLASAALGPLPPPLADAKTATEQLDFLNSVDWRTPSAAEEGMTKVTRMERARVKDGRWRKIVTMEDRECLSSSGYKKKSWFYIVSSCWAILASFNPIFLWIDQWVVWLPTDNNQQPSHHTSLPLACSSESYFLIQRYTLHLNVTHAQPRYTTLAMISDQD